MRCSIRRQGGVYQQRENEGMSAKGAMLPYGCDKWGTACSVHVRQSAELSRAACCIVDPRPL